MRSLYTAGRPIAGAMAATLLAAAALPAAAATEPPPVAPPRAADAAPSTATPAPAAASTPETGEAKPANAAEAPQASEPPKPKPLPTTLIARINLSTQTMSVQAHGKTIHSWKVSTGAPGYATPPGTFRPGWMAKDWRSRQYDDAPMPYSVFFNGGIAVHGTMNPGSLGRAASHGCVRVATPNAATFFRLVQRHGMAQTRIIVHGAQPFGRSEAYAARSRSRGVRAATAWVYTPSRPAAASRRVTRQAQARGGSDAYGYRPVQQPRRQAAARVQAPYWSR